MKIENVTATTVSIPGTEPMAWAFGVSLGHTRTIVKLMADDGTVGWGEAPIAAATNIINNQFAERITGLSVFETNSVRVACLGRHRDFGYMNDPQSRISFGALDVALWDLKGKATGQPLFRLLGGPVRDRAPFGFYSYTVHLEEGDAEANVPERMAARAREGIAETKAALFDFKVGRYSPECDAETVLAVREAIGPDVEIAVDANLGMSMDGARKFLRLIEPAQIAWVEEPVATLDGMARLRRDFGIPVCTHCDDLEVLRNYPEIDGVVGDLTVSGGISGVIDAARRLEVIGKRFWLRSNGESGIGFAAMCHLGMALEELDRPAQCLLHLNEDDLIEGDPWFVRDGGVRPPEKPGLGVDVDEASVKHYADLYEQQGGFTRFDAPGRAPG